MKNPILIFLFQLIFLNIFAQEYQYIPFPDSNAVWSEVYWKPISEPCPSWEYNKFALFNEDTVINGITYHKLFQSHASEITLENSICIGGIREDSLKRVWYYCFKYPYEKWKPEFLYLQDEIILYDFSPHVGDTIKNINSILQHYLIVKEINFIEVRNTIRRVFSFEPVPWVHWIEGIGNVKGLLFFSGPLPTNGLDNDLVCCHQNDTMLYYNNYYDGCAPSFVLNGVVLLPNTDIKVYPNPVTNSIVYFENLSFETLELFDVAGNLITEKSINGLICYELNTSGLPPGVYSYRLKTKGLIPTQGKLIIQ